MTEASGPPAMAGGRSESTEEQGKAQQVAGQAQEKAHETAAGAEEKAQEATAKAQSMLREQVDQRSTEAGEKVTGTAQDLRAVGEELRNQGKETPAKLADGAAERTERLGSYLAESDADRILADIEDFGRRQPLAVLAGGLVVGIAAARFLKASSRSRYQERLGAETETRELRQAPPTHSLDTRPVPTGAAPAAPAPATSGVGQ